MAYVRFNGGDGSFKPTTYDTAENDIFAYGASAKLV